MTDIRKNLDPELLKNLSKNYELFGRTFDSMFLELKKEDLKQLCSKTGSEYLNLEEILLDFFNQRFLVSLKDKNIYYHETENKKHGQALDKFAAAFILHYLNNSDGTLPRGEWIAYRDLPNGLFYSKTIPGVLSPIIKAYPSDFNGLLDAARQNLGGKKAKDISMGIRIDVFKYFPVLLSYEPEDEEFGADIRILFDSTASHHIKTDIAKTLTVYIVKRLTDPS